MKKIICTCLAILFLLTATFVLARGGTHYVRSYVKRDGTIVQAHRAGNPGSGVHCHNNVCN